VERRKFWGWGLESEGLTRTEVEALGSVASNRFGLDGLQIQEPPRLDELRLRPPRVKPPATLAALLTDDLYERASHTYGKSFRDLVLAFRREYPNPPDLVAFPRSEQDVADLLEWCASERLAAIPFGAGSSVARGIEPDVGDSYRGAVSIDLSRLDQVLEVDRASRAARIQAGALGPALEAQLKPHGLTLRHFPQSFQYSTLGGWIATRSGGHFATLYTHIDEFVESMRVVTPRGVVETRRLPGSGAGPAPDRLWCGSEGTLGIITEAWMRLQDRPTFRAGASVEYEDWPDAVAAVREISQSGLHPANCRLLSAEEALLSGAGDGSRAILVVAFESADHPLDAWMARAAEICGSHSGAVEETGAHEGAAGTWRNTFMRGGFFHDAWVQLGMVNETFETAVTWDRFERFHEGVLEATRRAVKEACGQGLVSCRFTHVYPDGPAPYYTVLAPGRRGSELEQWETIKAAASEAIIALGGTITHHHAVGRYHRPWYDRERPPLFAEALRAAKGILDPEGILNPGVLFDP
jgi:alkyldihydroxyacetonephosphate synthase